MLESTYKKPHLVWIIALVALSLAIVSYPTERHLDYTPIQSLDAIPALWLFVVLLSAWMAAILVLLRHIRQPSAGAALVACFGAVYFGFWTLHWPYGAFEDWLNLQSAQAVILTGHIQPTIQHYWEWPGLAFLTAFSSVVTAMQLPSLLPMLILVSKLSLCIMLYLLFRRILGDVQLAILATILAIAGNLYLLRFHLHPHDFVLVLLCTFMLLIVRNMTSQNKGTSYFAGILIVVGGIVITHLITSVLVLLSLLSVAFLKKFGGLQLSQAWKLRLVMPTLVIILAWQLFWGVSIFHLSADRAWLLVQNVVQGRLSSLSYARTVASVNTVGYPIWASATRWGVVLLVYTLGPVYAIWGLCRHVRFSLLPRIVSSWTIAAVILTALLVLLVPGGEEFRRFIFYGSLLTSPILVYGSVRWLNRRRAQILLSIVLLVVIVPLFLSTSNLVSTASYYEEDLKAGQFLWNSISDRGRVELYGAGSGASVGSFYLPLSEKKPGLLLDLSGSETLEKYAGNRYTKIASDYVSSTSESFFWLDPSFEAYLQQWFGRDGAIRVVSSPSYLLDRTERVYDNGMVVLLKN